MSLSAASLLSPSSLRDEHGTLSFPLLSVDADQIHPYDLLACSCTRVVDSSTPRLPTSLRCSSAMPEQHAASPLPDGRVQCFCTRAVGCSSGRPDVVVAGRSIHNPSLSNVIIDSLAKFSLQAIIARRPYLHPLLFMGIRVGPASLS
jgi:hypothetical protein